MPEPAARNDAPDPDLLRQAWIAREAAYAPYSAYAVGAAVRGASGNIYRGCNVENASYGLTICAERVAIFNAILAGERVLTALAVVADGPEPPAPCGACRQVLREFAVDAPVFAANRVGVHTFYLADLLPHAFGPETFQPPQHLADRRKGKG